MICKKCGHNIEHPNCSCLTKSLIEYYKNKETPSVLTDVYKHHNRVYCCENCNEPIDYNYIDMPLNIFFNWLKDSSICGDTREVSGKALIRYFELDKMLIKYIKSK